MPDSHADEPSMDEILASIRKIVADEPAAAPAEDELVLTQKVETGPAKASIWEPSAEAESHTAAATPAAAFNALEAAAETHAGQPTPAVEPASTAGAEHPPAAQSAEHETIATVAAAEAFDRLAAAKKENKVDRQSPVLPTANRNLEDLVREILEPTLRAWLDEHLPAIVQERVDEEIAHISRRRVS
jgi:uncharacterized protein